MENNNPKNPIRILIYLVLTLTFIILIFLILYLYNSKENIQKDLDLKISQIQNLNKIIYNLRENEYSQAGEIIKYVRQVSFMNEYVAICPLDGNNLYHKYNCEHYDKNDSFYIYSIFDAQKHGFSTCSYCKDDIDVEPDNSEVVYITDTGSKYHNIWCSYLNNSKKTITLEKAQKMGYSACSRCNP